MQYGKRLFIVGAAIPLLWAGTVSGQQTNATKDLFKCNLVAAKEGEKYLGKVAKAASNCLKKISTDKVKKGGPISKGSAKKCEAMFRKVKDSRLTPKDLVTKLEAKIEKKCAPGSPNDFTAIDVVGDSIGTVGVAVPINAQDLKSWCKNFGTDGTLDSLTQWRDCMVSANLCQAQQATVAQFPQAVAWLTEVQGTIETEICGGSCDCDTICPDACAGQDVNDCLDCDKNRRKACDALDGISEFVAALDSDGNGSVDITCGRGGSGLLVSTGQTDSHPSNEATCCPIGCKVGETCPAACEVAECTSGCTLGTNCCVVGSNCSIPCEENIDICEFDDGAAQTGTSHFYSEYGTGTIFDHNTGLMWEAKSDDGGTHDKDTTVTWADALAHIDTLNAAVFGGYSDWRAPNVRELESLTHLGNTGLAVDAAFDADCTASCAVTDCSCTSAAAYWSSTSYSPNAANSAWTVNFLDGNVNVSAKTNLHHVRAVRDSR